MPSYASPGVYVEEVSSGSKPIAGVGTSTAGFVGITERGEIGKAKLITSWSQFVREYGSFVPYSNLAYAVFGFFAEGGTSCYIVRTCHYANHLRPETKTASVASKVLLDSEDEKSLRVFASSEGEWGNNLLIKIGPASKGNGFCLSVHYGGEKANDQNLLEKFDRLTIDSIEDIVNYESKYIRVEKDAWVEGTTSIKGSGKAPKNIETEKLAGGSNGLEGIDFTDFIGDAVAQNGLHAFDIIDDVNLIAIPDAANDTEILANVTNEALIYCSNRRDCFFIADPPKGITDPTEMIKYKNNNNFTSSYGSLYFPWVLVNDPIATDPDPKKRKRLVPPSGVVAGTYAYTDSTRGVHKAPAGIGEGYLDSIIGVETIINKTEQGKLNEAGVNVIRVLPEGLCIWGARTMSKDGEWKYINVRRLFLYLEESIDKGTQWVVFEPNDPGLWGKVQRNLNAFLTRVWRSGALFGSSAEEAFFVKVDAENNPPEVRDAGQLIIEVGVAPVKPAEFVIIRVSQKTLMN